MFFESEIELNALKSYHYDRWDEDDYDTMNIDQQTYPEVKGKGNLKKKVYDSTMYEGGLEDQQ